MRRPAYTAVTRGVTISPLPHSSPSSLTHRTLYVDPIPCVAVVDRLEPVAMFAWAMFAWAMFAWAMFA